VFCALVLGVLDRLDTTWLGHYKTSAETLYYLGHALRRASYETGSVNDPAVFDDPSDSLLSSDLRAHAGCTAAL